jgi:NADPH-dependent glutamate synthase beta subunit-like oxidoreductase
MASHKCKNCGHDCHCGVPLFKDVRTYNDEVNDGHGEREQIEVCKQCRCDGCRS